MVTDRRQTFLASDAALAEAVQEWAAAPAIAVDTEGNSFFAYKERVCLVQVSTRDADWIIDPFACDCRLMAPVLSDERIEKVLHAAEFDVVALHRDFDLRIRNMFDTHIAAKSVARKKIGLAPLVEETLGIKLEKDEQRSDWGRRPLTAAQLKYAYADTAHLLALADVLKKDIEEKGADVIEEVATDCLRMASKEATEKEADPDAWEKHPTAKKMDGYSRAVLKALFDAREIEAVKSDKPLFRVLGDDAMREIAIRKAHTKDALRGVPGVSGFVFEKHGAWIIEAVEKALAGAPIEKTRRERGPYDPAVEERFEALRAWRKGVAEARGVDVEVISGNALLMVLAKAHPKTLEELANVPQVDAYRRRRYGEPIVKVLTTST